MVENMRSEVSSPSCIFASCLTEKRLLMKETEIDVDTLYLFMPKSSLVSLKGTVMKIEKALINDRLRILKVF